MRIRRESVETISHVNEHSERNFPTGFRQLFFCDVFKNVWLIYDGRMMWVSREKIMSADKSSLGCLINT